MTDKAAVDKLIIDGIDGLDGIYETNLVELFEAGSPNAFTSREGHRIKQMTGLRAGELLEAFNAGDSDLIVAICAIVLSRFGKQFDEDALWDAPMGRITFDVAKREQEGDAGPPVKSAEDVQPTEGQKRSGGDSSSTVSALSLVNDQRPTGVPA